MALRLTCPCGAQVFGRDDGDLVAAARAHLVGDHPGREYEDEDILMMATPIPDRLLPRSE